LYFALYAVMKKYKPALHAYLETTALGTVEAE
jgi:hypothetical protein